MSKKAKIEIEYIVVFVLALLVLVIILLYSGKLKEKALEIIQGFFNTLFGRK